MTPQERRKIVIGTEGSLLENVNRIGEPTAVEYTECYIDGAANALIRVQGAEVTARFVFALGDRVAAGVRAPTDFRTLVIAPQSDAAIATLPKVVDEAPPAAIVPLELPVVRAPIERFRWPAWALGVIQSAIIMTIARAWGLW